MEVVATILNETRPNDIEYLETMTKAQIIRLLKQSLLLPHEVTIALANDVSEMVEKTEARDLITLSEWLDKNGYHIEDSAKYRLANLVAQGYKEKYQKLPRKIARQDSRGKYLKKSYGYDTDELPVLKEAIERLKTLGFPVVRTVKT